MKKCYFFLYNLNDYDDFLFSLEKARMIKKSSDFDMIMEKYYKKKWQKKSGRISNTTFPEMLMFIKFYLKNIGNSVDEIEFVYEKNFFIFNEQIYEEINNTYKLVDYKDIYFATTRDMWYNPFFQYLRVLEQKKKVNILRRNLKFDRFYDQNIYYFSLMYNKRKDYLWDFIIPLVMNSSVEKIRILLKSIKELLWTKVWLVPNLIDPNKVLDIFDMSKLDDSIIKTFVDRYLRSHVYNFSNVAFMSANNYKYLYTILFCYNKINKKFTLYSAKRETLVWADLSKKKKINLKSSDKLHNFIKKVLPQLNNDSWLLYIVQTKDWNFVFRWFSHIVGFSIKDWNAKSLVKNYYRDSFSNLINNDFNL